MLTVVKSAQDANARLSMLVTLTGMVTLVKPGQKQAGSRAMQPPAHDGYTLLLFKELRSHVVERTTPSEELVTGAVAHV